MEKKKLTELNTEQDYLGLLSNYYNKLYQSEKHDSPDETRISLIRRLVAEIGLRTNGIRINILNIGAGRQSLETQLASAHKDKDFYKQIIMFSMDRANLSAKSLLHKKSPFVRSDAQQEPFGNNSFDFVISNMAIDFLPKKALKEASRILKNDGIALFNFHHPDLFRYDSDNRYVQMAWDYMKRSNILYSTEEEIVETLRENNLEVISVERKYDKYKQDTWWEIKAKKIKQSASIVIKN
jgi:SAM-dependent methyltransferase